MITNACNCCGPIYYTAAVELKASLFLAIVHCRRGSLLSSCSKVSLISSLCTCACVLPCLQPMTSSCQPISTVCCAHAGHGSSSWRPGPASQPEDMSELVYSKLIQLGLAGVHACNFVEEGILCVIDACCLGGCYEARNTNLKEALL